MSFKKLVKGFRRFRKEQFSENLAAGQSPDTLIIACSDSRNDPALLTQSAPGDIFVVRNVAALVPPYQPDGNYHGTSAAIEFAVKGLKVKNIVVLGHALCGGIQALIDPPKNIEDLEFLSQWVRIAEKAREAVGSDLAHITPEARNCAAEQASILISLNNLMTFPWIRAGVESGKIILHGWYFDMINGRLLDYDFTAGNFRELTGHDTSKNGKPGTRKGEWSIKALLENHA